MKLNVKKPIIFFDLETTGIDISRDRIVELCYIRLEPDGTKEEKSMRFNPTIPIPAQTSEVHGITDADVKDCPTFKDMAAELQQKFEGCDLAGFNSAKFDLPMLAEEIERVRRYTDKQPSIDLHSMKMVDVQNIFHAMEPRTLKAAYLFYCGLELENAHAAEADTLATYEVLKGQLDRYAGDSRIENNIDKLAKFSTKQRTVDYAGRLILNDKDEPVISFGKHKGKTAREVYFSEPSYFAWIDNGDFTLDTKRQFAKLKTEYEAEKKAAAEKKKSTTFIPRTKGYTPFEELGNLFSQEEE